MKHNYISSVILAFLVLVTGTLEAQDPHFSQYFGSPLTMNPALTGKNTDDWRAMAIYRSQWWGGSFAPFYTTAGSIEKAVYTGNSGKSILGFGFSFLTDASNSGLLKNNYFNASFAYNLDLDGTGNSLLGIGITASYANRLLDQSKFEFQSQFGSMGFQRNLPSGDPASILNRNYFDLNIGAHYSREFDKWGFGIGGSVFHAGGPQGTVYNNMTYHLPRRYTLHGSVFLPLKNASNDELHIGMVTDLQAGNNIFTLGAMYKKQLPENNAGLTSINLGLYKRFNDALYPVVGLEAKTWLLSFSYDIVNSEVKEYSNGVQSTELSLAVRFGKKSHTVNRIY